MKHLIRVPLAALALTASFSAPLLADEVSDCQNRVIFECAEAMKGENWAVRVALGIVCTGRLAGCSNISVSVNAF